MTTFKRWYLLMGLGVVFAAVGPRGVQIVWTLAALALIGLVVYGVVRGRRRSKRLFVDHPNKVLATLKHDRSDTHIWDAW